jgi:hypothetical protein
MPITGQGLGLSVAKRRKSAAALHLAGASAGCLAGEVTGSGCCAQGCRAGVNLRFLWISVRGRHPVTLPDMAQANSKFHVVNNSSTKCRYLIFVHD